MPIKIIRQDIIKIKCDAIVDPTDEHYSHGGGVDEAIHKAAGTELYQACQKQGVLDVGKAIITPAFALPCKYVITLLNSLSPSARVLENFSSSLLSSLTILSLLSLIVFFSVMVPFLVL